MPATMSATTGRRRHAYSYTADSIARALDVHRDTGLIRSWRQDGTRYTVGLNRADDLELRSMREAWVFVAGLASAHMAPLDPPQIATSQAIADAEGRGYAEAKANHDVWCTR